MIKRTLAALLLGAIACSGCAGNKNNDRIATARTPARPEKQAVSPASEIAGQVASVNPQLGFAVLSFPLAQMPPADARLNVYRNGQKVGEIKVTGPQQDENVVGDIVAGEVRKGDEARTGE